MTCGYLSVVMGKSLRWVPNVARFNKVAESILHLAQLKDVVYSWCELLSYLILILFIVMGDIMQSCSFSLINSLEYFLCYLVKD